MTRVAVLTPMASEFAPFAKRVALADAGDGFHTGRIGDVDVVVRITGIGTTAARDAAERTLDAYDVDQVVVVGIAGGIEPYVAVGDLVVPHSAHLHGHDLVFESSVIGGHTPEGHISTSDQLLSHPDHLAPLADRGVVALDMETAAVAAVCNERNVPWCAFRGVSDIAGDGGLDDDVLALMDAGGALRRGAALRYLLRHPLRIPQLARLGKGAGRAASIAARAAVDAIEAHEFGDGA